MLTGICDAELHIMFYTRWQNIDMAMAFRLVAIYEN
jgi:hypothetical protein